WNKRIGIFSCYPAFDRVPRKCDFRLIVTERRTGRDADLFPNKVDTADHLSNRMFNLKACVHLDECKLTILIEELQSTDISVSQYLQRLGCDLAQSVACFGRNRWRAGFLKKLLMTPLQAAIAFPEVHNTTMRIRQNLHFDVAWSIEVFFDVDGVVPKCCQGFRAGGTKRLRQVGCVMCHFHAATATARGGLDHHRVPDTGCDHLCGIKVRNRAIGAGYQGNAK